jgi:hypothetical protein
MIEARAFYTDLRRYLAKQHKHAIPFEPYKFTSDGWILLFPPNTEGERLLKFLVALSLFFAVAFQRSLLPHLSRVPAGVGISFGIEKGDLVSIMMDSQQEFVGCAIGFESRVWRILRRRDASSRPQGDKELTQH